MVYHLKKFRRQYQENEIFLGEITTSIASYKEHLKHGHTDRLQQKVFHEFILTKESIMKEKRNRAGRKLLSLVLTAAILLTMQGMPILAETVNMGDSVTATEAMMEELETAEFKETEGQQESEEIIDEIGASSPVNPVHHCTNQSGGSDKTDWSYVYFGSYPQTEVTGDALTSAITGASYDTNGDAWVNGTKYRRVSERDTNYGGYFGNSEYRYFKWERIKWRVLKNDGSTLFVVADKGIDCKDYHNPGRSITWENCTLRNWLNNDFYGTAFSSSEQNAIVQQNVVNEDNPSYNTEGGNDTKDDVYLLSIGEVTNPEYGFCKNSGTYSASRWMQTSDYAHAMGAYTYSDSSTGGNANCYWWLRSPGYNIYDAADVNSIGNVGRTGDTVDGDIRAVVPVLHINLTSDIWSAVDEGISGEGEKPGMDAVDSDSTVKVKKISISAISKKIAAGKKVSLSVTVFPKNASNSEVKWKSGNKKYAIVNSKGVVITQKAGKGETVTITATAADGSGKKATIKLKLMKNAVTKVQIKNVKKALKSGKSMTLKATVKTNGKNANKTLKWTTSNGKYATVNSQGKVTAKKAGKGKTVTITAMSTDGTNKKAKVKIKIK